MTPHCGRLDRHQPHEWLSTEPVAWQRRVLTCPGVVVIGGGEVDDETRAHIADEKAEQRRDDYWSESA